MKIGDIVERDGKKWRVVSIIPRLVPFRKKNQDTTIVGYCLGLVEIKESQIEIWSPPSTCDGSGDYAYDPNAEDGKGQPLGYRCPGCRACS